jgi:hypothetical protein
MGGWDDAAYYEEEASQAAFIEETLKNISEEGVRNYLGTYGDAIDQRIKNSMMDARMLITGKFFPNALVSAVTATELTIRFLLLRPLMQAAFLSEDWANLLTQRITTGQTDKDRQILSEILRFHDIDLHSVKLPDGKPLWSSLIKTVYPKRNAIIHRAESASLDDALLAVYCADQLREQIVLPFAEQLGFTLKTTKRWSHSKTEMSGAFYNARDPFTDKSTLPLAPELKR